MRFALGLSLAAALAGCTSSGEDRAAVPPAGKVVEWAAIAGKPRPGPDNSVLVDVDLQVTVNEGWHVYSLTQLTGGPTAMKVTVSPPYELASEITGPPATKGKDNNFGIETETYSGEQIFKLPLKLARGSLIDQPPIEIKVRSQACSDRLCLPAKTTTLTVEPAAA